MQFLKTILAGGRSLRHAVLLATVLGMAACGGGREAVEPGGVATDAGGAQVSVASSAVLPVTVRAAQDSAGAPALPDGALEAVGAVHQFTPMGLTAPGLQIAVPYNPQLLEAGAQALLLVAQPGGEWTVVANARVEQQGALSRLVAAVPQLGYALVVQVPAEAAVDAVDEGKVKSAGTSVRITAGQPLVSLQLQSSQPLLVAQTPGTDVFRVTQASTLVQSLSLDFNTACAPRVEVFGVQAKMVGGQLNTQVFTLASRAYPVGSTAAAFTATHSIDATLNGSFATFATATCTRTVGGSVLNQLLSRLPAVAPGQYFDVNVPVAGSIPHITQAPQNASVTSGSTVGFSVVASGSAPLAYQWQRSANGSDWANVPGATGASLNLTTTLADHGSLWRVIVSNASGQATSTPAQLSVTQQLIAPSISSQPLDQSVVEGENASFSIAVSGQPAPSIQWQTRMLDASNTETGWVDIAGATQASYTTPATTLADHQRQFRARISNSAGSLSSAAATLSVNAKIIAPTITQQPVGAEVIEGASADFSVAASGSTPLSYQWFKDGVALVGANGAAVSIPTSAADAGKTIAIMVRISNAGGSVTSQVASLVVRSASIEVVSAEIKASEGGSVSTSSGLTVEVPAGALAGDSTVTLRTQAPTEFSLPAGFVPRGDVVTVDLGGNSLSQPLYLSFPDPEDDLPADTILVLAELTPKAGSASKASASMANARVKATAISPGLFAVGGDAFKGGRVTLDAARSGAYAIGAAAADVVGGVIGLSDPRRAQMPGTKDTACSGNDFLTRDNVSLDDESVLQSRHTACAIAPTVNTSVTSYNTAGIPRYGDMSVAWKWNVHGPSGVLSKNIRLSFDYTYVPRGTTTTAGAPVLKVLAKATCDVTNINAFNPDVVNCGGTADYTLNTGARDQGKDFKLTVDWGDSNGRKIAEFRPVLRLYYTTDGSTPQVDAAGNPQASTYEFDNSNMQLVMRCDKGQVWGSSNGCVFPKAAAVLDVSGTPQSAQHMREAAAANPYLPGRYPGLKPGTKAVANEAASPVPGLQRLRVASLINANRKKIQKVCAALPSPPPAGGSCPLVTDANVDTDAALEPCDCDEYPFASSREGAAMPRTYGDASAKYIGRSDNRKAGAQLGAMLRRERIFDPYDHKRMRARTPAFDPDTAWVEDVNDPGNWRLADSDAPYSLDFESRYWIAY